MEIRTYEDYVDRMHAIYPTLTKASIGNILKHGTKAMLRYRRRGIDLYLRRDCKNPFYLYIGDVTTNAEKRNKLYLFKYVNKIRHHHTLKNIPYDGYYYFNVKLEDHEKIQEGNTVLPVVRLRKLLKEAQFTAKYGFIYRVKMMNGLWTKIYRNFDTHKAEPYMARIGKRQYEFYGDYIKRTNEMINSEL